MCFYIVVIVIYLVLMCVTRRYRAEVAETVSGPLKPLAGIAAWIYEGTQHAQHIRKPDRAKAKLEEDMAVLCPDRVEEQKRDYYLKKGTYVLLILFVGNLSALCLHMAHVTGAEEVIDRYLHRNGYGEGARTEILSAHIDSPKGSIEEEVELLVQAREYTEAEALEWIGRAIELLPELILGQNESFDHVTEDLVLISEINDIPVRIEWISGDYRLIDHRGRIMASELPEEGTVCMLTAKVSCEAYERECTLYVCLYPKMMNYAERIREDLHNALREAEVQSRTESRLALPQEVNGEPIVWIKRKKDNSVMLWTLAFALAIGIWFAMDRDVHKKVEKKELQMRREYPELISKLVLYMGAGMTIRGAAHRIAAENESHRNSIVYEEIARICREMDSGISEGVAYLNLGKRCKDIHYMRLSMLLSQNLRKGNAGLTQLLEKESQEAFEERKRNARKYGEEAATKLLVPMFLMLMIVMVVIMVPAFISFGG